MGMIRGETRSVGLLRRIDMLEKSTWWIEPNNRLIAILIGVLMAGTYGCTSGAPKPAATMTQDQVRSNAEKAFDKLKQEEKNRTVGSGAAPY